MGAPDAASAAPAPVREAGAAIVQHETKLTETVLTGGGIISRKLVVVTPENLTVAPDSVRKIPATKSPGYRTRARVEVACLRSHHKLGVPCRQLFPSLPRTKAGRIELESGGPAAPRPAGVRPGASSFAAGDAAGPPRGRWSRRASPANTAGTVAVPSARQVESADCSPRARRRARQVGGQRR